MPSGGTNPDSAGTRALRETESTRARWLPNFWYGKAGKRSRTSCPARMNPTARDGAKRCASSGESSGSSVRRLAPPPTAWPGSTRRAATVPAAGAVTTASAWARRSSRSWASAASCASSAESCARERARASAAATAQAGDLALDGQLRPRGGVPSRAQVERFLLPLLALRRRREAAPFEIVEAPKRALRERLAGEERLQLAVGLGLLGFQAGDRRGEPSRSLSAAARRSSRCRRVRSMRLSARAAVAAPTGPSSSVARGSTRRSRGSPASTRAPSRTARSRTMPACCATTRIAPEAGTRVPATVAFFAYSAKNR